MNFQKNTNHTYNFFLFLTDREIIFEKTTNQAEKYQNISKKTVKKRLLSALKFEKMSNNKAQFECNGITKMSKKGGNAQNHFYYISKNVKKGHDNNA